MKKYIIILITLLTSCGYSILDTERGIVISDIESKSFHPGYCYYYGTGTQANTVAISRSNFQFIDSCGKFQIGDTIKLTK